MNNKGFTLVEVLAVSVIMGCLVAITVPSFIGIFNDVKRKNLYSKIAEIESAANKYGDITKDDIKSNGEVKASTYACKATTVTDLIKKGYLVSENDSLTVIYNPTDNKPLDANIYMCYCKSSFEIKSFYAPNYSKNTVYHVDDVVKKGNEFYKCIKNFNYNKMNETQKSAIDSLGNSLSTEYFIKETC